MYTCISEYKYCIGCVYIFGNVCILCILIFCVHMYMYIYIYIYLYVVYICIYGSCICGSGRLMLARYGLTKLVGLHRSKTMVVGGPIQIHGGRSRS